MTKTLRTIGTAAMVMCAVATTQLVAAPQPVSGKDEPHTLAGCVVAGQARGTYMITSLLVDGVQAQNTFYTVSSTMSPVSGGGTRNILYAPGETTRMTSAPGNAVYNLDSTKHLRKELNNVVEITGTMKPNEPKDGKLKIETNKDLETKTTLERGTFKSVTVKDNVMELPGLTGDTKVKAEVPIYKFKVDTVKRLNTDCATWTATLAAAASK